MDEILIKLSGNEDMHIISWISSNLGHIGPPVAEFSALECLKIQTKTHNGVNDVSTFLSCFSVDSFDTRRLS